MAWSLKVWLYVDGQQGSALPITDLSSDFRLSPSPVLSEALQESVSKRLFGFRHARFLHDSKSEVILSLPKRGLSESI